MLIITTAWCNDRYIGLNIFIALSLSSTYIYIYINIHTYTYIYVFKCMCVIIHVILAHTYLCTYTEAWSALSFRLPCNYTRDNIFRRTDSSELCAPQECQECLAALWGSLINMHRVAPLEQGQNRRCYFNGNRSSVSSYIYIGIYIYGYIEIYMYVYHTYIYMLFLLQTVLCPVGLRSRGL